jgi:peptidoglycan/LPS O-acetylase OafA/YrhL
MDRLKSAPDFIVNRVSRLFPAYWVAMCLTLAFVYAGNIRALQISSLSALANVTMLQGFLYLPAVDGAYWTLTVELGFYASMLALWAGPGFRRLEPILIGWLALKWLMYSWVGMPSRIAMLLVLKFIPFFMIGMLFYRIWAGHRRWPAQVPYFAAALLTVFVTDGQDLFVAGCCLIVIFTTTLAGWLRFLCVRPILWFGTVSYSLYLVHENIGFTIMLKAREAGLDHWTGFAMALATVVAMAWALNRFVERPAGRMIGNWWKEYKASRSSSEQNDAAAVLRPAD